MEPPLNPFVFPAETRGRFRMLVVAALAAAVNIGVIWSFTLGRGAEAPRIRSELQILQRQIVDESFFHKKPADQERTAGRAEVLISEILKARRKNLLVPLLSVAVLSASAALVYSRHPQRIRKRYRALPLEEENAPSVVRDVRLLALQQGISPVPSLEYSKRHAEPLGALSFGFRRSPALLFLSGSPQALEEHWDHDHRYSAVATHELGHIIEGDAQDRERASAIWWALTLCGYLPLLLIVLVGTVLSWYRGNTPALPFYWTAALPLQFAFGLGIVSAIWMSLSRVRELYADWRVKSRGMQEALIEAIKSLLPRSGWWRTHPSRETRLFTLEHPVQLFRVTGDLSFQTGLLMAFVFVGVQEWGLDLLYTLFLLGERQAWRAWATFDGLPLGWRGSFSMMASTTQPLALLGAMIFFFLYARLVGGTLDLQVQREAMADLATGRHGDWGYLKLIQPALLLAAGFEVGLILTPLSPFIPRLEADLVVIAVRLTLMTLFAWLWLMSTRAFSRLILGSQATQEFPARRQCVVAWLSSLVFMLLCLPIGYAALFWRISQGTTDVDFSAARLAPITYRFYYLAMPTLWTLLNTVMIYAVFMGLCLILIARSLFSGVRRCPACGEPVEPKLVVGRTCRCCERILSPWLYHKSSAEGLPG